MFSMKELVALASFAPVLLKIEITKYQRDLNLELSSCGDKEKPMKIAKLRGCELLLNIMNTRGSRHVAWQQLLGDPDLQLMRQGGVFARFEDFLQRAASLYRQGLPSKTDLAAGSPRAAEVFAGRDVAEIELTAFGPKN